MILLDKGIKPRPPDCEANTLTTTRRKTWKPLFYCLSLTAARLQKIVCCSDQVILVVSHFRRFFRGKIRQN